MELTLVDGGAKAIVQVARERVSDAYGVLTITESGNGWHILEWDVMCRFDMVGDLTAVRVEHAHATHPLLHVIL